VSLATVLSSGATGIAWADIAISPKPMANADAARIFISATPVEMPGDWNCELAKHHGDLMPAIHLTSDDGADASGGDATSDACASGGASDGDASDGASALPQA
jgi:hypothetical protein